MKKLNMLTVGMLSALYLAGCNPVDALNEYEQNRFNEQAHAGEEEWIKADSNENIYVPEAEEPFGEKPVEELDPSDPNNYILTFDETVTNCTDKYGQPNGYFEIENYKSTNIYDFLDVNNLGYYAHIDTFYDIRNLYTYNSQELTKEEIFNIAHNFDASYPATKIYKYHFDMTEDVLNYGYGNELEETFDATELPSDAAAKYPENYRIFYDGFYVDGVYFKVVGSIDEYGIYELDDIASADLYLAPVGFYDDGFSPAHFAVEFALVRVDNIVTADTLLSEQQMNRNESTGILDFANNINTDKYDTLLDNENLSINYIDRDANGNVLNEKETGTLIGFPFESSYSAVINTDYNKGIVVIDCDEDVPSDLYYGNRHILVVKFDNPDDMYYYDAEHDTIINEMLWYDEVTDGYIYPSRTLYVDQLEAEDGTIYEVYYTNMRYIENRAY